MTKIVLKKNYLLSYQIYLKKLIKIFNKKKIYKIGKGKYYKPLYKGINIKKPNQHSYKYIYNAIKAQKAYGGIKIGKYFYRDVFFYNKKKIQSLSNYKIIECKNKKQIILIK
tara:strand:- start:537 stop:872 length:336 start_codon:yes stop_codon:yes gene_type:complete